MTLLLLPHTLVLRENTVQHGQCVLGRFKLMLHFKWNLWDHASDVGSLFQFTQYAWCSSMLTQESTTARQLKRNNLFEWLCFLHFSAQLKACSVHSPASDVTTGVFHLLTVTQTGLSLVPQRLNSGTNWYREVTIIKTSFDTEICRNTTNITSVDSPPIDT